MRGIVIEPKPMDRMAQFVIRRIPPAAQFHKGSLMTVVPPAVSHDDLTTAFATKARTCLRCETTFRSEWSGERICPVCKRSAAWRAGSPLASHPIDRRK